MSKLLWEIKNNKLTDKIVVGGEWWQKWVGLGLGILAANVVSCGAGSEN